MPLAAGSTQADWLSPRKNYIDYSEPFLPQSRVPSRPPRRARLGQEVEQEVPGAAGNPGQEVERDFRGDMCVSASQRSRVDMISEVEISPQARAED